jgi:ubiquinone/menaquinone biosynthesis C-methylase UbiE
MRKRLWAGTVLIVSFGVVSLCLTGLVHAQRESVRPGINKKYEDPDVSEWVKRFESGGREIFTKRQEILRACGIEPGMAVADVGAGTGLLTRLLSPAVGDEGKVYAVDIVPEFVEHVRQTCREKGLNNVRGVVCEEDSVELPPNSIDVAVVCDTYHHFEYPHKTMASVHRALRPGGRVIFIEFKRIEGETDEWIFKHVRAGQEVFTKEVVNAGFEVIGEKDLLEKNYFVIFRKRCGEKPGKEAKTAG